MKMANARKLMRLKQYGILLFTGGTRDSVVGIANRYGLDGPGIESGVVEIFRICSDGL